NLSRLVLFFLSNRGCVRRKHGKCVRYVLHQTDITRGGSRNNSQGNAESNICSVVIRERTSPFEKQRREYSDNFFEISGNYMCQFKIRKENDFERRLECTAATHAGKNTNRCFTTSMILLYDDDLYTDFLKP
ncbi:uncharacterized protein LOC116186679, partial [Apis dorsata]|uniref:uncharacterized protein LOC116186679 n=1 Tax=Apis dorsata TaxID=7462 RepID=UPI00129317C3